MIEPEDRFAKLCRLLDATHDREKAEDRRDLAIIFAVLCTIGIGFYTLAAYVSTHP